MNKKLLNLLLVIVMLAVFVPTALAAPPTPMPRKIVEVQVDLSDSPLYSITFKVVRKTWWHWEGVDQTKVWDPRSGSYLVEYEDSLGEEHLEWEWHIRFNGRDYSFIGGERIPLSDRDLIFLPSGKKVER